MVWNGRERRRYPRAVFSCKIFLDFAHREIISHTDNIGKGGIRVSLEEELRPSNIVSLTLFLGKGEPIKCEGIVIWTAKKVSPDIKEPTLFYTGIEFTAIGDSDREEIGKLVDEILSRQEDSERNKSS